MIEGLVFILYTFLIFWPEDIGATIAKVKQGYDKQMAKQDD